MNYVNETPFPNPFRFVSNPHRDTIIGKDLKTERKIFYIRRKEPALAVYTEL
jgi:hypothetical protein